MTPSSPESSTPRTRVAPLVRPLRDSDRAPLEAVLRGTGSFYEDEIEVAMELIDCGIEKKDDYRFLVAETPEGRVAGYVCFGPTPLTEGVFDLYWIAVDKTLHNAGIGRALVSELERILTEEGGRMILIETASKPSYEATRAFYLRTDYLEEARVRDFYRIGDDKVIYAKRLR